MDARNDFAYKRKKYMPIFPRATGKPTVYIEGYPSEDDEPMAATGFHDEQINILSDQLKRYFRTNHLVYVGVDSFIYYREGHPTDFVAPDIFVVCGVERSPRRRSFYTWAEGAVPDVAFEFLSESTARHDRGEKIKQYLIDIGVQEYFIHQPELDKPPEFCGWRISPSGEIEGIPPDAEGGLFSRALNLWLRWEEIPDDKVRLLRPYEPDGTPIPTSREEEQRRQEAELGRQEAELAAQQAEAIAQEEAQRRQRAEALAREEAQRRREAELAAQRAEAIAQEEAQRRREAELAAQRAEAIAQEEAQRRQRAEAELEQLLAKLAALEKKESE